MVCICICMLLKKIIIVIKHFSLEQEMCIKYYSYRISMEIPIFIWSFACQHILFTYRLILFYWEMRG